MNYFSKGQQKNKMFVHKKNETLTSLDTISQRKGMKRQCQSRVREEKEQLSQGQEGKWQVTKSVIGKEEKDQLSQENEGRNK